MCNPDGNVKHAWLAMHGSLPRMRSVPPALPSADLMSLELSPPHLSTHPHKQAQYPPALCLT
jgi:hypothetical protein